MIKFKVPAYGYEDLFRNTVFSSEELAKKYLLKNGPKGLKLSRDLNHWTMQDRLHRPEANGWYITFDHNDDRYTEYYYIIELNFVDK